MNKKYSFSLNGIACDAARGEHDSCCQSEHIAGAQLCGPTGAAGKCCASHRAWCHQGPEVQLTVCLSWLPGHTHSLFSLFSFPLSPHWFFLSFSSMWAQVFVLVIGLFFAGNGQDAGALSVD